MKLLNKLKLITIILVCLVIVTCDYKASDIWSYKAKSYSITSESNELIYVHQNSKYIACYLILKSDYRITRCIND